MSFLIAAATATVTGAMAMAIATFKVGTRRTIFSFYLFIVTYLVGLYLLDQTSAFKPVIGYETDQFGKALLVGGKTVPVLASTSWLTGLHPFLALKTLFYDKNYMPPEIGTLPPALQAWPFGWWLTHPASFFVSLMFTISLVLILPSVVLLRRLAQSTLSFRGWALEKLHIKSGDRTRKPRFVWNNPIAWREAKTKASAARATVMRYGFMAAAVAGAVFILVKFSTTKEVSQYIDSGSYDATNHILTVYGEQTAARYSVSRQTIVSFKDPDNQRDADKPGTLEDLRGHWAAEVTSDPSRGHWPRFHCRRYRGSCRNPRPGRICSARSFSNARWCC